MKATVAAYIMLLLVSSCNQSTDKVDSDKIETTDQNAHSAVNETAAALPLPQIVALAEKKFGEYLPTILQANDAVLDLKESHTGDFTGDGIPDVAIYFSLSPSGGGNAHSGQGLALYKNLGDSVEVMAGYEPESMFSFDTISNGKIQVTNLAYAKEDGYCCPSIKTPHFLTVTGTSAY